MATIHYHKYDPAASQHDKWAEGGAVPYAYLSRVFSQIEAESKRLKITEMMANCFRSVMARSPSSSSPSSASRPTRSRRRTPASSSASATRS